MDEAAEARMKIIAKTYKGPEGGKPAVKTWQDARDIDPGITLNEVKGWFKLNVQRTKCGGKGIATSHPDPTTSSKLI